MGASTAELATMVTGDNFTEHTKTGDSPTWRGPSSYESETHSTASLALSFQRNDVNNERPVPEPPPNSENVSYVIRKVKILNADRLDERVHRGIRGSTTVALADGEDSPYGIRSPQASGEEGDAQTLDDGPNLKGLEEIIQARIASQREDSRENSRNPRKLEGIHGGNPEIEGGLGGMGKSAGGNFTAKPNPKLNMSVISEFLMRCYAKFEATRMRDEMLNFGREKEKGDMLARERRERINQKKPQEEEDDPDRDAYSNQLERTLRAFCSSCPGIEPLPPISPDLAASNTISPEENLARLGLRIKAILTHVSLGVCAPKVKLIQAKRIAQEARALLTKEQHDSARLLHDLSRTLLSQVQGMDRQGEEFRKEPPRPTQSDELPPQPRDRKPSISARKPKNYLVRKKRESFKPDNRNKAMRELRTSMHMDKVNWTDPSTWNLDNSRARVRNPKNAKKLLREKRKSLKKGDKISTKAAMQLMVTGHVDGKPINIGVWDTCGYDCMNSVEMLEYLFSTSNLQESRTEKDRRVIIRGLENHPPIESIRKSLSRFGIILHLRVLYVARLEEQKQQQEKLFTTGKLSGELLARYEAANDIEKWGKMVPGEMVISAVFQFASSAQMAVGGGAMAGGHVTITLGLEELVKWLPDRLSQAGSKATPRKGLEYSESKRTRLSKQGSIDDYGDEGTDQESNSFSPPSEPTEPKASRAAMSLEELLGECNLSAYLEAFRDQGYDDVQFMISSTNEEWTELVKHTKMKPGHAAKLRRALGQLKPHSVRS
ncbi:hypothetical protein AAMO2058_000622500 [Amorphochlora amoebiformis]